MIVPPPLNPHYVDVEHGYQINPLTVSKADLCLQGFIEQLEGGTPAGRKATARALLNSIQNSNGNNKLNPEIVEFAHLEKLKVYVTTEELTTAAGVLEKRVLEDRVNNEPPAYSEEVGGKETAESKYRSADRWNLDLLKVTIGDPAPDSIYCYTSMDYHRKKEKSTEEGWRKHIDDNAAEFFKDGNRKYSPRALSYLADGPPTEPEMFDDQYIKDIVDILEFFSHPDRQKAALEGFKIKKVIEHLIVQSTNKKDESSRLKILEYLGTKVDSASEKYIEGKIQSSLDDSANNYSGYSLVAIYSGLILSAVEFGYRFLEYRDSDEPLIDTAQKWILGIAATIVGGLQVGRWWDKRKQIKNYFNTNSDFENTPAKKAREEVSDIKKQYGM